MEDDNRRKEKELEKKGQELGLHEQQLQAWKERLETETVVELREKSQMLGEWEKKLGKKEELLKMSLMELDRKQSEMQGRVEKYVITISLSLFQLRLHPSKCQILGQSTSGR